MAVRSFVTLDGKGKLLLVKTSATSRYQGRWQLPGGKVTDGESVRDAVIREVLEETGFLVEPVGFHTFVIEEVPDLETNEGRYRFWLFAESRIVEQVAGNGDHPAEFIEAPRASTCSAVDEMSRRAIRKRDVEGPLISFLPPAKAVKLEGAVAKIHSG